MSDQVITNNSRIVMHFSLLLDDGTEVINTFNEEPIAFTIGDGTFESEMESVLIGKKAGDEQTQELSGNDIYGTWDSDNRQWIDKQQFPPELDLEEGHVIAFSTPAGDELAGILLQIEETRALIDFNHPLSGRTLIFKTAIISVGNKE